MFFINRNCENKNEFRELPGLKFFLLRLVHVSARACECVLRCGEKEGGGGGKPAGRWSPALPPPPLHSPLLHALLPRRLHLPPPAHCHKVAAAGSHGHRLHSTDRAVPRTGLRLLGPEVGGPGSSPRHRRHRFRRLCAGCCPARPTGTFSEYPLRKFIKIIYLHNFFWNIFFAYHTLMMFGMHTYCLFKKS